MDEEDHIELEPTHISAGGATSRFRILQCLGSGGMGDVHLAEDSQLQRRVAIKSIRGELCKDDEIRKRIERECLLHAKIGSHPHIVTLYDRVEQEGRINLIMEYVEGETLQQLLERNAKEGLRLPWREGVKIVAQTLDALARIHAQGIVHRDIKPGNILLSHDEDDGYCAKLMDFGIARPRDDDQMTALTREGAGGPGTPLYMAPEQIDPRMYGELSPTTDVYAVGVVLYQVLSGHPPFMGTLTEIFNGHLNSIPPPLSTSNSDMPPIFMDILKRALAKRPGERFPSARMFREELLHAADALARGGEFALPPMTPATSSDASRTLTAAEAGVFSAAPGSTMLDTSAALRGGARGASKSALGILGLVIIIIAVIGGYFMLRPMPGTESVKTTPDSPSTETMQPVTQNDSTPPELAPAATSLTEPAPQSDLAAPASTTPTALPSAEAPPVSTQTTESSSEPKSSAMDALLQNWKPGSEGTPPETSSAPAASTTPSEPKVEPKPKPKPKPEPTPVPDKTETVTPEPATEPPAAEPSTDDGGLSGWKVIRKEDRKIE